MDLQIVALQRPCRKKASSVQKHLGSWRTVSVRSPSSAPFPPSFPNRFSNGKSDDETRGKHGGNSALLSALPIPRRVRLPACGYDVLAREPNPEPPVVVRPRSPSYPSVSKASH